MLIGCNTTDDTNYFDDSITTEDSGSWLSITVGKSVDYVIEKINNFNLTEQSTALPKGVYDYDVEEDFPLKKDNTESEKKILKEYWDNMWVTTEDSVTGISEEVVMEDEN